MDGALGNFDESNRKNFPDMVAMKQRRKGVDHYRMYIDGQWVDAASKAKIEVENPTTETVIGTIQQGDATDAQRALESAQAAQPGWAATPAVERGNLLQNFAAKILANRDRLARLLAMEQGKVLPLAYGEVEVSADFINFPASAARRLEGDIYPSDNPDEHIWIHKVPYGVTVGILAWNFPLALACRKIGPALTAGNVMVVKPPPLTPLTVLELGKLATEAGLPKGVLNIVTGQGAEMGAALVKNPITRLVTMTGSTRTGQEIFRSSADNLSAVRLELGGKAPFIVLEDGDVDKAVEAAMVARYLNNGQVCTCSERFYIHDAVYDEFVKKFTAASAKLKLGDPLKKGTDIGPKVSRGELEKMEAMVQRAVDAGCKVVLGGTRPRGARFKKGHWFKPTILTEATNDMEIMRSEVFGVVSPIMRIGSYEEALQLANDSDYGLSAYLFTRDMRRIQRAVGELHFGEIYVNRTMGEQRQGFHNGYRLSGTGGEDGKYGMENYLEKKTFYVNFS
ncbi:MAG: aldehyde dehydrogenase [Synoicihabitans sp.]